jgi:hypothetical protein
VVYERYFRPDGLLETIQDHPDGTDGKLLITRSSDVAPLLDENAAVRNSGRKPDTKWGRKIGSIDPVMIDAWGKAEGINPWKMAAEEFEAWVIRKLMDPDFKSFRTVDRI